MTATERARFILDSALNAPSAYAKAAARKLLAYDTNTPGWWHEVDRLRSYMDHEVGTPGGPMWETPLVPQVLAHKGFAAEALTHETEHASTGGATAGTGLSKYLTGSNMLILALGVGIGGVALYWYLKSRKFKRLVTM